MLFREITKDEVDATRVTLKLIKADDGTIVGRVITLALNESNKPEMMSTSINDPSIKEAIALASELAQFKEQDVDVYDPDGLWTNDLGPLQKL